MSDILIEYNKNDFLYVLTDPKQLPSKERCKLYDTFDSSGCSSNPSEDCINHEICKNRDNANEIYQLQNNHLGSNVKLEDTNKMYKNEYIRSIHLTIGIIGIAAFIFYSK